MGVDTCALLDTNFEEFEKCLGGIIVKKEKVYDNRLYAWTFFFDIGDKYERHSTVYNERIDAVEYDRSNNFSKEDFKIYWDEKEKLSWTNMDSTNLVNDGVPDGYRGLRLSFGHSGKAPEFLKELCHLFGGWYQESDCSGEDYVRIDKSNSKYILKITLGDFN